MKKTIFYSSVFLFVSFLALSAPSFAVTTTPTPTTDPNGAAKNERWVCLKNDWCNIAANKCSGQGNKGHRTRLSAKPDALLVPNSETYIVECVGTSEGQVCTTGRADLDQKVFQGSNNLERLSALISYKFQGLFEAGNGKTVVVNPIQSDNSGNLSSGPVEWQSQTKPALHKFLALNYITPSFQSGKDGGQQQATFDLENSSADCVSERYDPYGTVFDSQSLEPIPNATVTLLEKTDAGYVPVGGTNTTGIDPVQRTEEDGMFSYVVPDGSYILKVSKGAYTFPASFETLAGNYSKIYSDIYPAFTTDTSAAQVPGMPNDGRNYEIEQTGQIAHRDVPLDPIPAGIGKKYPIKLMEYYYQLKDKYSSILTVEGRVSHPFGKIKVYTIPVTSVNSQTASPVRLLQTVTATKNGSFKFEVDQSQLQPLERFGKITIEKADLTAPGLSWSGKVFNTIANAVYSITGLHWRVEAQESQTSVGFDPILNYIEGHAMDSSGLVLKNATVGVYLKFSQKPSYVTKTDENGYFKISSEYLPFMPYTIQYTSSNGTKGEVKTSEFLAANAEEMKTNNINPYAYKNSKGETISPKPTSANADTGSKAGSNDNNNNKNLTGMVSSSNYLMVVVIVLLLLGISGLIMGVYVLKRKKV